MKNTKLIQLLARIQRTELNYLEKVVNSPCMNQNQHVKGLFDLLKVHHPKFESPEIDPETVFAALFPDREFDELKMRHLMSMLLKLAEESLILRELKDSYSAHLLVVEAYQKRDLSKHVKGAMRTARASAEAVEGRSPEAYYQSFRLGMVSEDLQLQGAGHGAQLRSIHNNLDRFYMSAKLRQACAILSRRNLYQNEFEPAMLEEWVAMLDQLQVKTPLVELYRLALDTLMHPASETAYPLFYAALEEHDQKVTKEIAVELHILARNYCIKRMNQGDTGYVKQLFDLYDLALERGYLVGKDGKMKASAFKNVVTTGLKLRAFDRIALFIDDFGHFLPEEHQQGYLVFCKGLLQFHMRQFREAVRMIRRVEFDNFFIEMDARILLIKCWYELQEFDLMEATLKSTRKFLGRNRLIAYHRKNYGNTLRLIERLLHVQHRSPAEIAVFRKKVEAVEPISERSWILSAVVALE